MYCTVILYIFTFWYLRWWNYVLQYIWKSWTCTNS